MIELCPNIMVCVTTDKESFINYIDEFVVLLLSGLVVFEQIHAVHAHSACVFSCIFIRFGI